MFDYTEEVLVAHGEEAKIRREMFGLRAADQ
jgi:hypothetical protein